VALKARHKAAIAAKKLDFNAKLGPALDKYQLAVAAVTKFFVAEKLNQPAVQKALYAARALEPIAQNYLGRVKGLGDPAEKELTAFLKAIVADSAGWEQVADLFDQDNTDNAVSARQLAGVKALYGPLDRLSSQLENLSKSLPAAQAELKAGRTKVSKPAAMPPKLTGTIWAQVNRQTPQEWSTLFRAKVDAVLANASSVARKRDKMEQDVAPLLTLVTRFDEHSDYQTLKQRAQAVAAGSLADYQQQTASFMALQNDPELLDRLGFVGGLPFLQNTRASKAIDHGRDYAEQLIAVIRQLP
jgi:hypothetical protein